MVCELFFLLNKKKRKKCKERRHCKWRLERVCFTSLNISQFGNKSEDYIRNTAKVYTHIIDTIFWTAKID